MITQQQPSTFYLREQRFKENFPAAIVAFLAVLQMLATWAIIALEIVHNLINIRLTNLFAGFWTAIPFTILWVSMFAVVCCCRRRSCAAHAAIENAISFIFANILIAINIAFIQRPSRCFFSKDVCEKLPTIDIDGVGFQCLWTSGGENCDRTRIDTIKAQLAVAIFLAISCLLYLILFFLANSRANRSRVPTAAQAVMASVIYHQQQQQSMPQSYAMPVFVPAYAPSAPVQMPTEPTSFNNPAAYPYAPIYPSLPNDRF